MVEHVPSDDLRRLRSRGGHHRRRNRGAEQRGRGHDLLRLTGARPEQLHRADAGVVLVVLQAQVVLLSGRERDGAAVGRAREALRGGARGDAALFPLVLGAVEAEATLGEISDDLRAAFGTYTPRA